jgi:hypothetical protein
MSKSFVAPIAATLAVQSLVKPIASHDWSPTIGASAILSTKDAAAILTRRPQTLRIWACYENGPIRPVRIHGRLGWRVQDIQALLSGTSSPLQSN